MKRAESLKELAQRLEAAGARFAVIGGLAASARWGTKAAPRRPTALRALEGRAACALARGLLKRARGREAGFEASQP